MTNQIETHQDDASSAPDITIAEASAAMAQTTSGSMSWEDKHRPEKLHDLLLPPTVQATLKSWVKGNAGGLLIKGDTGIGKTTTVQVLIDTIGLPRDQINGGIDRGVAMVQDIKDKTRTKTVFNEKRAIFIDEIDRLTPEGFSALGSDTIVGQSDTAVFFATCNDLKKIPSHIQNRFYLIDLDDEIAGNRKALLEAHVIRAFEILDLEDVLYDPGVVRNIVKRKFPHTRSWIKELEVLASTGQLTIGDGVSSEPTATYAPGPNYNGNGEAVPLVPAGGSEILPDDGPPVPDALRTQTAALLSALVKHLRRFVNTSDANLQAIALFILHAHQHDAASHSPLLWLNSPEKRCGKSTALKCIAHLVPRPKITSNISVAGMLHGIAQSKPTFLIDEMEHALRASGGLHGILNLGHAPGGVMIRSDGEYPTWAPKVVALIGELPGTLADRSIRISLRRRLASETVERYALRHEGEAKGLLSRCESWADNETFVQLEDADPALPGRLDDRAQDNWRPLIAIADLAGDVWPSIARQAAEQIGTRPTIEEPSAGILILQAVRSWLVENDDTHIASKHLADLAAGVDAVRGKPRSRMIQVARVLSGHGVDRGTFRVGAGTEKGFPRDALEDAVKRYLGPEDLDAA